MGCKTHTPLKGENVRWEREREGERGRNESRENGKCRETETGSQAWALILKRKKRR